MRLPAHLLLIDSHGVVQTIYSTTKKMVPATYYLFRVSARSIAGWGHPSDAVLVRTATGRPGKPQPPALKFVTETSITMKWIAPAPNGAPIDRYELQFKLSTFTGNWYTANADIRETECKVTGLRSRTFYRFRMRAHNRYVWV